MTKIVLITNSAQNCHNVTDHKGYHKLTDISLFCTENSGLQSVH